MTLKLTRSIPFLAGLLVFVSLPLLAEEGTPQGEVQGNPFLHGYREPLVSGTVGRGDVVSPRALSSIHEAFDVDGDFNLSGNIFKDFEVFIHNDGGWQAKNTALGRNALEGIVFEIVGPSTIPLGSGNTATGAGALHANSSGYHNTGLGIWAALYTEDGVSNTAVGAKSLLYNVSGDKNTAIGAQVLYYNKGDRNTALGWFAGKANVYGNDNIFIGSPGTGTDYNTLRIGKATGLGNFELQKAFISGIGGVSLNPAEPHVCIDPTTDQLGKCTEPPPILGLSSARFKRDIRDLDGESGEVFALRPVKFRYREEVAGDDSEAERYGLIAEEVAQVLPGLVIYDDEGRPLGVHYDALTPLLLAELERLRAEVAELRGVVAQLEEP